MSTKIIADATAMLDDKARSRRSQPEKVTISSAGRGQSANVQQGLPVGSP